MIARCLDTKAGPGRAAAPGRAGTAARAGREITDLLGEQRGLLERGGVTAVGKPVVPLPGGSRKRPLLTDRGRCEVLGKVPPGGRQRGPEPRPLGVGEVGEVCQPSDESVRPAVGAVAFQPVQGVVRRGRRLLRGKAGGVEQGSTRRRCAP